MTTLSKQANGRMTFNLFKPDLVQKMAKNVQLKKEQNEQIV
jgi:hypothetical protein